MNNHEFQKTSLNKTFVFTKQTGYADTEEFRLIEVPQIHAKGDFEGVVAIGGERNEVTQDRATWLANQC